MADLATIAVFADAGVTPYQAQYRYVGEVIARKRARLVCLSAGDDWSGALVDSAIAHGGAVTLVVSGGRAMAGVPRGVTIEHAPDRRAAGLRAAQVSQALIGLPGGLDSTAALYRAWTDAGGSASGKPVGLLNRRQAFEVVRGFLTDVAAVGLGGIDHLVQVSENFDDLWARLDRLVD